MNRPVGMLAELTYACPLHCPYCSNPLNLAAYRDELSTVDWQWVLSEARALGVLQAHFSGGEPLQRSDLVEIVAYAHDLGLYTNLITSAIGFSLPRARQLKDAGLDHVQISIQADDPILADRIAGARSHEHKIAAARLVKELDWPLTLNIVLHRYNIDRIDLILNLAEKLGADRLELANTQYYGWALRNRGALLPTKVQLDRAEEIVHTARQRLRRRMEIIYVLPDYYSHYPKPCMGGWGRQQLTVTPNGDVLPCPVAHILDLPRANVREHSLAWIWEDSPIFQRFRGTKWMPEPCQSCPRREIDFGGCRCQAFQFTGDAARTDPVCHLSPDHWLVAKAVHDAHQKADQTDPVNLFPRTYKRHRPLTRLVHLPEHESAGSHT
jgi:pyrroloquinoline quinone biosynthesis protein E